ncbi:MAG: outer membrane beta-barrel protein [Planctomycetota bacterium]|nr:outer membrane beta-barrel protein [Planctomycetota bacterium]
MKYLRNPLDLLPVLTLCLIFLNSMVTAEDGESPFSLSALTLSQDGDANEVTVDQNEKFGVIHRLKNVWNKPRSVGEFSGWASLGYHDGDNGLFNAHPGGVNLHQLWLALERDLVSGEEKQRLGYRVDIVYGADAEDVQSFGNQAGRWDHQNGFSEGKNGWAIPQAYLYGKHGKFDYKLGHFLSPAGYESALAPNNFFYSHSQTMKSSQPRTHTGVLTSFQRNSATIYLGWTLGWDTGFDQLDQGGNGLIGFSKKLTDDTALTYMNTVGNLGWRGHGYSHSIVLDLGLTENLNYVFQSDFVSTSSQIDAGDDIGITNYLFYTVSECWQVGTRIEWWRDNQITKNSITVGLNWRSKNGLWLIRPEVRSDWVPELQSKQTVFAVDAIVQF